MYDSFKRRYIKLMKFKNFILKHIIIFIVSFIMLIGSITTLLICKGNIIHSNTDDISVTYGDDINLDTKIFLGKANYEYQIVGDGYWHKGLPVDVGDYLIKPYGQRLFGTKNYCEEFKLNIVKKETLIEVSNINEIVYGDNIPVNTSLAKNDSIDDIRFYFETGLDNKLKIIPVKESIKIVDNNSRDVTNNYKIEVLGSNVNVKKNNIKVKTSDLDVVYDDEIHDNKDYFVSSGKLGYNDKLIVDFTYNGFKDVINCKNEAVVKIVNDDLIDVSKFYNLTVEFGDINIQKKDLTISSLSFIKSDDGLPLKNDEYSQKGLINGHNLEVSNYSIIDEPGTILNDFDFIITNNLDEDVTINYNVIKDLGNLTICPAIKITSSSNSKEYDGTFLIDEDFVVDKVIPENHTIKVINNSKIKDVGTIQNELEYMIIDQYDNDVTSYYNIETIDGLLEVYKRKITLESNNDQKEYDGTGLSSISFETDRLVKNNTVFITKVNNLNPNVGKYENSFSFIILDDENKDVTSFYDIKTIWDEKEIYKRNIVIKSNDLDVVYDNKEHSDNTYNVSFNSLVASHKLELINDFSSFIDSGFYSNEFLCQIVDKDGNIMDSNYEIEYDYGSVNIRKRLIGILTGSKNVFYDGNPVKVEGYDIEKGIKDEGLVDNHKFIMIGDYQEFVKCGSYKNSIDFKVIDENNNDVTKNYFGDKFGTIVIRQPSIKVTTGSAKKVFDGLPLTNPEFEIENVDNFNFKYDIKVTGTITYAGQVDNEANIKILDDAGNNITSEFTIIEDFGVLEVVALNNGQLNNGTGKIESNGSVAHKPQDKDSINDKEAFSYTTNCIDRIYFRAFSFGDYDGKGWLKPKTFDVKETSPLYFTSDALRNYEERFIVINKEEQLDFLLPYYCVDGPQIDNDHTNSFDGVNNYELNFMPYVFDYRDNMSVSSSLNEEELRYYNFVKENYLQLPASTKNTMLNIAAVNELNKDDPNLILKVRNFIRSANTYNENFEVYPKDVDIASYFLTKTREGNSQHFATAAVCMYRALGIPARYTVGFSSDPIGRNEQVVTWKDCKAWVEVYVPKMGWINLEVCNNVVYTGGYSDDLLLFDITDTVYIKPKEVSKEYDGTPLYAIDEVDLYYSRKLAYLLDKGYSYQIKIDGEQTELGSSESTITKFILYDSKGNDVTDKFKLEFLKGEINITKPQIKFIVKNYKKDYDGQGLHYTKNDVSVYAPEGYRVNYDISGDLDKAGESRAKISNVVVLDESNNDVTNDFYINVIGGYMNIEKILLEISIASDVKVYDGTPLKNNKWRISKGQLLNGHKLDVIVDSEITDIGKTSNRPSSIKIVDENGDNVKYAYYINVKAGTLEILE